MIIVKFQGGLGNQMFQYALGRALSQRTGQEVYYDRSWYKHVPPGDTPRPFELGIFSLPLVYIKKWELIPRIPILRTLFGLSHLRTIVDDGKGVRQEVLKILPGQNVYLNGYWQSEQYFQDAALVIRDDFTFHQAPDRENKAILEQLAADLAAGIFSVSIHIRRGDYNLNPKTNAYHGLLPLEYYRSAMSMIEGRVGRVSYYVFSDDLPWCRENLKFNAQATFVDINTGKPSWMDMRLMSSCQHHIIANSSFSWWGAWLNTSKDKVIVAPRTWLAGSTDMGKDVVPEDWLKI